MTLYEQLQSLPDYWQALRQLENLERDRIYCRHDFTHFIDVARIAWIENLEKNLGFNKESIYLTALLHDLGRIRQYEDAVPHDQAGVTIAKDFLDQLHVSEAKQAPILDAIADHRNTESKDPFVKLMRRADKASRACFQCPARESCNWPEEKKNTNFLS